MPDFAGRWLTTFGPMTLQQEGTHVRGVYVSRDQVCPASAERQKPAGRVPAIICLRPQESNKGPRTSGPHRLPMENASP